MQPTSQCLNEINAERSEILDQPDGLSLEGDGKYRRGYNLVGRRERTRIGEAKVASDEN
jgi:hypothetical protein